MDLRRVRAWDWAAGIAGAVLIGSLFLDWYKTSTSVSAWDAFTVIDVILFIAGLSGIAIVVANATQRTAAVGQGVASLSFVPALVAAVLAVYRALSPPGEGNVHREIGLWIGLVAALALLAACWNAMNDKRLPRATVPEIETRAAPEPK